MTTTNYGQATYSPEDNKLRFYPDFRLDKEDYDRIKKAGFRWAPKQELFVKPKWGPIAEDLMLEWCGSIEDEDKSPEDRAADRAERFAMYRNKRRTEAEEHADNYDNGPAVHGYQSQKKADIAARRHDRQRVKAFTQWDKAEYWQQRTKGVISHALYKAKPAVRRTRILRIEADQRKNTKEMEKAQAIYAAWEKIRDEQDPEKAFKLAEYHSNHVWGFEYKHPRHDRTNSLWSLLVKDEDPITGHEAAEIFFAKYRPINEDSFIMRYAKHYELRLSYERQMLEAEGGTAANVEMIAGGFIGKQQILKVNKSNVTGLVVSVSMYAPHPWDRTKPDVIRPINIQKLSRDAYRVPTEDELKAFKAAQSENKTIRKAKNAGAPKLINPDKESAERLQALWNAKAKVIYDKHRSSWNKEDYKPTEIRELTQSQYSARSKGSYSHYGTIELKEDGHRKSVGRDRPDEDKKTSCKVRQCPASASFSHQADCVIVITDKPRKPLPEFHAITEPAKETKTFSAQEGVTV